MTNEHSDVTKGMKERLQEIADSVQWAARGGFYELYAQAFSGKVNKWIEGLPDEHQASAQALANTHGDYCPDAGREGRWVYDQEDNDICFVTNEVLRRTEERRQKQLQDERQEEESRKELASDTGHGDVSIRLALPRTEHGAHAEPVLKPDTNAEADARRRRVVGMAARLFGSSSFRR